MYGASKRHVSEIARVTKRRGQVHQILKTQVILILNFSWIHCDYLLITWRAKSLNFWMLKTATIVGRGHRSRTLLNLLATSFHSPTFWKRFFTPPCYSSCFHFPSYLLLLILRYIPRQLSRNETPLLQKNNSIEEAVARQPEDQSRECNFVLFTKQDTLFIDQSINSVILPSMLSGLKSYVWFQKGAVLFQTKVALHSVQVPLRYIHFQIEHALRAGLILKSQVWLLCFSVSLSLAGGKDAI